MIRAVVAVLFLFLLPGFTLVNALFPSKGALDEELDMLYRVSYGLALSVALVIIIGFFLGEILPSSGDGYFVGRNIWFTLVSLTFLFFFIGWYRGAYRWIRYIHPSFAREPSEKSPAMERKSDTKKVKELQELTRQRNALKQKIKKIEKKIDKGSKDMKKHYTGKKDELERRLERVDKRLKEAERKREKEF